MGASDLSQSRKKVIKEQVQKQRRRNTSISIAAVAIVIVFIVAAVIFWPRGSVVPLPAYLDRCVTGTLVYHSHPSLTIIINGTTIPIPPDVGRSGSCDRPLHTHPSTTYSSGFDGTIHIETDSDVDYHLGDFFLIWGNSQNNANLAILNSNQIFTDHVAAGHTLTMTVNNQASTDFQNLVLSRNAQPNTSTSQNITITYT